MKLLRIWFEKERKGKRGFNLNKYFAVILLLVSLITVGCRRVHVGERPHNYPPAKWVSETPDVWFEVNDETYDTVGDSATYKYIMDGQLNSNGKIIELEVYFDPGSTVSFIDKINSSSFNYGDIEKYDYVLLEGNCKFSPDKLVVTVDKKKDKVFNGEYKKITFDRIPEESTPIEDDLQ